MILQVGRVPEIKREEKGKQTQEHTKENKKETPPKSTKVKTMIRQGMELGFSKLKNSWKLKERCRTVCLRSMLEDPVLLTPQFHTFGPQSWKN